MQAMWAMPVNYHWCVNGVYNLRGCDDLYIPVYKQAIYSNNKHFSSLKCREKIKRASHILICMSSRFVRMGGGTFSAHA